LGSPLLALPYGTIPSSLAIWLIPNLGFGLGLSPWLEDTPLGQAPGILASHQLGIHIPWNHQPIGLPLAFGLLGDGIYSIIIYYIGKNNKSFFLVLSAWKSYTIGLLLGTSPWTPLASHNTSFGAFWGSPSFGSGIGSLGTTPLALQWAWPPISLQLNQTPHLAHLWPSWPPRISGWTLWHILAFLGYWTLFFNIQIMIFGRDR